LPGFVVLELIEGCRNRREVRRVLAETAPFRLYWPSAADCDRAITTFARADLTHGLGLVDLLIDECAVGLSAVL